MLPNRRALGRAHSPSIPFSGSTTPQGLRNAPTDDPLDVGATRSRPRGVVEKDPRPQILAHGCGDDAPLAARQVGIVVVLGEIYIIRDFLDATTGSASTTPRGLS